MSPKSIKKKHIYIIDIIVFFFLLLIDQISKFFAVKLLKGHPAYSILKGIIEFHYIENSGAAFGLLKGEKTFFLFCSTVVFSAIIYVIIRCPGKKRFIHMNLCFSGIIAGATGNLLDRFFYDNVIDFIYISKFNLPIFNVADIFITLSTIIIIFLMLFYYKEDDLNFLKFKEKRLREID